MLNFQAGTDFNEAIKEVSCLLEIARSGEGSHPAHSALLKSSVLLLTTKVESFLESVLEESRYFLERCELRTAILPTEMIVSIFQATLDDALISKIRAGNIQAVEKIKFLMPFLSGNRAENLPIEIKFSYGKHGESEVKKIFKRIGLPDIFKNIQEFNGLEDDFSSVIKADINSLTAIRNNIIHSDASPAFTVEQISGFVERFSRFATLIVQLLTSHCSQLKDADAAYSPA